MMPGRMLLTTTSTRSTNFLTISSASGRRTSSVMLFFPRSCAMKYDTGCGWPLAA